MVFVLEVTALASLFAFSTTYTVIEIKKATAASNNENEVEKENNNRRADLLFCVGGADGSSFSGKESDNDNNNNNHTVAATSSSGSLTRYETYLSKVRLSESAQEVSARLAAAEVAV
eukprot:PhM_4_TR5805/c0_g1_i1/m.90421